jgi:hypothetical protein
MALAFIHLMAPEISQKKERWQELHKLAGSEHWTALVFKARLSAYGEGGFKQSLSAGAGYLLQAGNKKVEYLGSRGRSEWDVNNYEVPSYRLAFEITQAAPGKFPALEFVKDTLTRIEQAQAQYLAQWPNTRAGKLSRKASSTNEEAVNLGEKVIKLSQSGNQNEGMLQNVASLRGEKMGDKQVIAQTNPKVDLMLMNALKQSGELNNDQKKLLEEAQQKRFIAQGYIAQVQSDLVGQLMESMNSEDPFISGNMLAPVFAEAQNALIRSCEVSRKWEQAMRAKKTNVVEKKNVKVDFSNTKDE